MGFYQLNAAFLSLRNVIISEWISKLYLVHLNLN